MITWIFATETEPDSGDFTDRLIIHSQGIPEVPELPAYRISVPDSTDEKYVELIANIQTDLTKNGHTDSETLELFFDVRTGAVFEFSESRFKMIVAFHTNSPENPLASVQVFLDETLVEGEWVPVVGWVYTSREACGALTGTRRRLITNIDEFMGLSKLKHLPFKVELDTAEIQFINGAVAYDRQSPDIRTNDESLED